MKVSIDQIINRAKMELGLTGTTHSDAHLEKLINEAATWHINALDSYIISCSELIIDCFKARLPDSAVELICYSFPDVESCSGCCLSCMNPHNPTYSCNCPTYFVPNRGILTNMCDMGCSAGLSANFFDVQGGYIIFPETVTATTVKVWYRGINIDEDGVAVIDEKQERALAMYAAWMYSVAHFKSYASEQRVTWKNAWIAQKSWLRGSAVQADARLHKGELAAIARAILINPMMVTNRNG